MGVAVRVQGDETGSDNEVQRTMLQIVTELDGFDPRGNIKVSTWPKLAGITCSSSFDMCPLRIFVLGLLFC